MKLRLQLSWLLGAVGVVGIALVLFRSPQAPRRDPLLPHKDPAIPRINIPARTSRPSSSPHPSYGSTTELLILARSVLQGQDPEKIQSIADMLRREARLNPLFLRTLADIVLNSGAAPDLREMAAFVLGSLPTDEA